MEYKLKVKTSWDDITIADYQLLKGLDKPKPLQILSILTDKTVEELREMPIEAIQTLTEEFQFLDTQPTDLTLHEPFYIDGIYFKPRLEIDKYKAGELIDLLELLKDPTANLHLILAIATEAKERSWYLRWKEKDWDIRQKAEFLLERCPAGKALQAYGFFLTVLPDLQRIGENYSG